MAPPWLIRLQCCAATRLTKNFIVRSGMNKGFVGINAFIRAVEGSTTKSTKMSSACVLVLATRQTETSLRASSEWYIESDDVEKQKFYCISCPLCLHKKTWILAETNVGVVK
jgi:hypothetical protein